MSAQLRLTLDDHDAACLDAVRGPATRTAYALHLLRMALTTISPEHQMEVGTVVTMGGAGRVGSYRVTSIRPDGDHGTAYTLEPAEGGAE